MNFLNKMNALPKWFIFIISYLFLFCLGILNYLMGLEISFSVFYLIPILFTAWITGRKNAIIISIAAAVIWELAVFLSGHIYSNKLIPFWNAIVRLGFFLIVTIFSTEVKKLLDLEKLKATIDPLTGIPNSRAFYEFAEKEILRAKRYHHTFGTAYIDLDNFKAVNDSMGHIEGDKLLKAVAKELQQHVRATDIIARLGGDEFAVMLTEINEQGVRNVIKKIQGNLLKGMNEHRWPVTVSIGYVFFKRPPKTASEMVKYADDLMYEVKKSGKNGTKEIVFQ